MGEATHLVSPTDGEMHQSEALRRARAPRITLRLPRAALIVRKPRGELIWFRKPSRHSLPENPGLGAKRLDVLLPLSFQIRSLFLHAGGFHLRCL
jgi:hypothetical protein